ncbi:putative pilus system protein FilA [Acinetobacter stercoris]|uniref:DUF6160 domain-containing protein n=1 Tax=Acinetobacter stercoris TaxID=2126983 RepID=A0A2U3MXC0_9GAMM|nr:DUF6160 family protein [Acinetobacter stercoris]SPL70076.1 hypothetical protein KPC_1254 [Acinetobacter stercoris]
MKLFAKLALVSAVAVSANAMAMEKLDDAALSATTGQDGLNIGIGATKITIDHLYVHDGDGLVVPGTPDPADPNAPVTPISGKAGSIDIQNVELTANASSLLASKNLADISIDTDGGGGKPFLNVSAAVSGLDIKLGKINVTDAEKDGTTGLITAGKNSATILNGLSLTTGVTKANIQLGNTPQGAMIKLDGSMVGGLTISDISLHDASAAGGGDIVLGKIKVNDTGSNDLALNADVAVTTNGLKITALKTPADVYVQSIKLGTKDSASIGDVQISGLKVMNGANAGASITISGH